MQYRIYYENKDTGKVSAWIVDADSMEDARIKWSDAFIYNGNYRMLNTVVASTQQQFTHFDTMIEAYNKIGLVYHVFNDVEYTYLVTMNKDAKDALRKYKWSYTEYEIWSDNDSRMQFDKQGNLLSY